jgi:ribonuclease R
MKSQASLHYGEVQEAMDGKITERTEPFLKDVIKPLYSAYEALKAARAARQPLDLDLPERKIVLDDKGKVASVNFRDRLDAHRLIEEFMVLANVAAAETLIKKRQPLLFRVHEEPSQDKLDALRDTAQAAGLNLAKGQVLQTRHLNALLNAAAGTDDAELINISTLRSMQQAYYYPENFGHFGLALRNYAHFTSPIRRYADLIVHRALITAHGWGKDGLSLDEIERLEDTATHISATERRSMLAERDTTDRYLASYLAERVGNEFSGRISGIARFGAFVKLDETGADGLVPVRSIGQEYFHFDAQAGTLMGSDTGLLITIGQRVTVRLTEAAPVTGGLELELLALEGADLPKGRGGSRKGGRRRSPAGRTMTRSKAAKSKTKADKIKRKVTRKRK